MSTFNEGIQTIMQRDGIKRAWVIGGECACTGELLTTDERAFQALVDGYNSAGEMTPDQYREAMATTPWAEAGALACANAGQ